MLKHLETNMLQPYDLSHYNNLQAKAAIWTIRIVIYNCCSPSLSLKDNGPKIFWRV